MAVAVQVADLRAAPGGQPAAGTHDADQETQLLYGERVRALEQREAWTRVEAIEQPEFSHDQRWTGYPGWLPSAWLIPGASVREPTVVITAKWATVWADGYQTRRRMALPLGTMLYGEDAAGVLWRVRLLDGSTGWVARQDAEPLAVLMRLPRAALRQRIVAAARLLLGDPYFWGGRSPQQDDATLVTGVDCSGLVNLAYRAAGMRIPRDAHEQYLRAQPVTTLEPADLIFLSAAGEPTRMVHVMLYAGNGDILEGPGTGRPVHGLPLATRLGRADGAVHSGDVVEGQTVVFGRFLE